jgi:hypothetical protein
MKTTITRGIALFALALIFCSVTNKMVAQSLVSDQQEYLPGTIATLSGSGFTPAEVVTLSVTKTDGTTEEDATNYIPWTVSADEVGSFETSYEVPVNEVYLDPTLAAKAEGESADRHAETTFKGTQGGTGVVTITADNGSCLGYTAANGNGPDNWEVVEGGSYTIQLQV